MDRVVKFLLPLFLILLFIFPFFKQKHLQKEKILNITVIYSPTCPHCKNLLSYIESKGYVVRTINVYHLNESSLPEEVRKEWEKVKGVPFVFAKVNGTYIIIEGYPSKFQEKNGYFYGKDYEYELCIKENGTPIYINGTYAFCNISGIILGNRYAIDWLINQCLRFGCK